MKPRIELLKPKKLIGLSLKMSVVHNRTGELWEKFGPRIKEIPNRCTSNKISLQVYEADYYQNFKPTRAFEKWALVEVTNFDEVPEGLKTFLLEGGPYAIFDYKGSSAGTRIFQYIYGTWLPNSNYVLANRPHFEVLGEKYRNNDSESEEEIWIPVEEKNYTVAV